MITIYSKHISQDVKNKIISDNVVEFLEDCNENYIKKNLGVDDGR